MNSTGLANNVFSYVKIFYFEFAGVNFVGWKEQDVIWKIHNFRISQNIEFK